MGKLLLRFHEKFSRFFDRNGSLFASLILTPFMDKWEWTGGWKLRYAYHHHNFFSTLRISWLWQGLSERSLLLTAFFFTWNWSELCIRRIGEARIGTFFVEWRWMVFDLISEKNYAAFTNHNSLIIFALLKNSWNQTEQCILT